MGNSRFGSATDKFIYAKPTVTIIDLNGDETLATGCKSIGGRVWPTNPNCGFINNCNRSGS